MTENSGLSCQTAGEGPLVVLLHGLLMSGESWRQSGLISVLSQHYCVACPDLPGHGNSVKSSEAGRYSLRKMAANVIAVIDRLGYERAHIIGYSAGGWLATGLLEFYPQRLSSLIIGGWDVVNGLPQGPHGRLSFADFMAYAQETAPEMAASVTEQTKPGLSAFFSSLSQPQQVAASLKQREIPTLFWAGRKDYCYPAVASWAADNDFPLLTAEGDHLAAMLQPDVRVREALCRFIADAQGVRSLTQ